MLSSACRCRRAHVPTAFWDRHGTSSEALRLQATNYCAGLDVRSRLCGLASVTRCAVQADVTTWCSEFRELVRASSGSRRRAVAPGEHALLLENDAECEASVSRSAGGGSAERAPRLLPPVLQRQGAAVLMEWPQAGRPMSNHRFAGWFTYRPRGAAQR
jgi:hypothetical protein